MTFRIDGEEIPEKAERLDQELDQAQKSLREAREKRLSYLEIEVADAQDRLRQIQGAMEGLRGAPRARPQPSLLPVLLPLGMVALVGFGFGHVSMRRGAALSRHTDTGALSGRSPDRVQKGGLVAPSDEASTDATPQQVSVRWSLHLKRAQGLALGVGASCALEGDFSSDGEALDASNLSVECDGRTLYRKGDFAGSTVQLDVDEFPSETRDSFRYGLLFQDRTTGGADRRSEAAIDTEAHTAVIWREAAPSFRLEFEVDDALATTFEQEGPLFRATRRLGVGAAPFVTRQARVQQVTGQAAVQPGARCSMELMPALTRSGYSCRLFVRCGDKVLYGGERTGFADCMGSPENLQAEDEGFSMEDGDPKLHLDLAAGTLSVTDNDLTSWSVSLQLEKAPARKP